METLKEEETEEDEDAAEEEAAAVEEEEEDREVPGEEMEAKHTFPRPFLEIPMA
jgi:hypothetical protein